jgi:hypothetical protein
VYPLYKFSQSYSVSKKTLASNKSSISPHSHLKLSHIFANLESAMVQACSIYQSWPSPRFARSTPVPNDSTNELDRLLDNLQSTVSNIPPFTPGENTLVWVYTIAASQSSIPKHCAFFSSRLAELLDRIGHQDISGYLAGISVTWNYYRE